MFNFVPSAPSLMDGITPPIVICKHRLPPADYLSETLDVLELVSFERHEPGYFQWLVEFRQMVGEMHDSELANGPRYSYVARRYWLLSLMNGTDPAILNPGMLSSILADIENYQFTLKDWCTEEVFWLLVADLQLRSYVPYLPKHCENTIKVLCLSLGATCVTSTMQEVKSKAAPKSRPKAGKAVVPQSPPKAKSIREIVSGSAR